MILLRHGESEGNADLTLYRTKPDNAIELTEKGRAEARAAGERIRQLLQGEPVRRPRPGPRTGATRRLNSAGLMLPVDGVMVTVSW